MNGFGQPTVVVEEVISAVDESDHLLSLHKVLHMTSVSTVEVYYRTVLLVYVFGYQPHGTENKTASGQPAAAQTTTYRISHQRHSPKRQ